MTDPKMGHEPTDASITQVFWFGITFVVGFILINAALATWFFSLRLHEKPHFIRTAGEEAIGLQIDPRLAGERKGPPEPRLQRNPQKDLQAYFQKEKLRLSTYDWVEPQQNRVRIPIERAMDLLVQKLESPDGRGKPR